MIILGLNGSPHRQGNTAALLKVALEAAGELGVQTEEVFVQEIMEKLDRPYCTACSSPCTGKCYRGTELEQVFKRLGEADGVLMASPVYFGTASAQLKSFWDKTRRLRGEKRLLNVVGGAISSGGSRFGGQETTLRALHSMMLIQGMLIAGDCYDEKAPGHHGVCSQQPTEDDSYALKRAAVLGKRVAQVSLATGSLRQNRPLGRPPKG
ncbi:MAG TPA: flavodoxin family protein [Firmicutes bacterium]|nr:flavodoxin family protein [Bacillota bacterium]